jgi:xanthine dehydrogenase accessory factor
MSFANALFRGESRLQDIAAIHARTIEDLRRIIDLGEAIPAGDFDIGEMMAAAPPDVLVDARMRKRGIPEDHRGLAALTVGLGPGFVAGENVDLAIETAWGKNLGARRRRGAGRTHR